MDIDFRSALVISIAVHMAIFLPLSGLNKQLVKERKDMVIDYVTVKEEVRKEVIIKERPPVAVIRQQAVETPKVEIEKQIKATPQNKQDALRNNLTGKSRENPRELAKKQAEVRKTQDYISYYQLIREKIRRNLKDNYHNYYAEGDVELIFVLNSDGTLASLEIENAKTTGSSALCSIATQSVKESAPFAPFPKPLRLPRMAFSLVISFQKK